MLYQSNRVASGGEVRTLTVPAGAAIQAGSNVYFDGVSAFKSLADIELPIICMNGETNASPAVLSIGYRGHGGGGHRGLSINKVVGGKYWITTYFNENPDVNQLTVMTYLCETGEVVDIKKVSNAPFGIAYKASDTVIAGLTCTVASNAEGISRNLSFFRATVSETGIITIATVSAGAVGILYCAVLPSVTGNLLQVRRSSSPTRVVYDPATNTVATATATSAGNYFNESSFGVMCSNLHAANVNHGAYIAFNSTGNDSHFILINATTKVESSYNIGSGDPSCLVQVGQFKYLASVGQSAALKVYAITVNADATSATVVEVLNIANTTTTYGYGYGVFGWLVPDLVSGILYFTPRTDFNGNPAGIYSVPYNFSTTPAITVPLKLVRTYLPPGQMGSKATADDYFMVTSNANASSGHYGWQPSVQTFRDAMLPRRRIKYLGKANNTVAAGGNVEVIATPYLSKFVNAGAVGTINGNTAKVASRLGLFLGPEGLAGQREAFTVTRVTPPLVALTYPVVAMQGTTYYSAGITGTLELQVLQQHSTSETARRLLVGLLIDGKPYVWHSNEFAPTGGAAYVIKAAFYQSIGFYVIATLSTYSFDYTVNVTEENSYV